MDTQTHILSEDFRATTVGAIDFIKTLATKKTNFEKVRDFHKVFGLHVEDDPVVQEWSVAKLRIDMIDEEAGEVALALARENVQEIAKELADLVYVAYGAAVTYGIDLDQVFAAVHRSNMSKVNKDGSISRREDGKILKGDQYTPPDLSFLST